MMGYGIDFGTTNSVAAFSDGKTGKTLALTDKSSNLPHPSVVWYRPNVVEVGRNAKYQIREYSEVAGNAFVTSVKRKLGHDHSYDILGEPKTAWEVAADIFGHLQSHANQEYKHQIENAVVTVPVYYDGRARRELRRAANKAGIEIQTFIHEPFAAVVGYCLGSGRDITQFEGKNILVFDWGGGTLDITICRVSNNRIYELATAGLNEIAGDFFDGRIEDYARNKFVDQSGFRDDILVLRPGTPKRLTFECERAKISLSSTVQERIQVARFFRRNDVEYDLDVSLGRVEFEALIAADMEAAVRQVHRALGQAALSPREVSLALLIGGSSRIPLLQQHMFELFGPRTVNVTNADTIIAEGAAQISRHGWLPYLARPIQVRLADESLYTVFELGRVLKSEACRKDATFYCTDNRDGEARLVLAETLRPGDSTSLTVKEILSVLVDAKLPKPYQHERVYAVFEVDEDLIMHVSSWSATQEHVSKCEIHDLCYGLRLE